jgi:flagellar motor switch protein FliN/FliY
MAETVEYAPFETTTAGPVEQPAAPPASHPVTAEELSRLHDVSVELAVEVGRTQMTIREALALGPGSIVTLNRLAGEPVDLLVNGKPIARGEVVVIDEEFGLRVTEVLAPKGGEPSEADHDA